jgi:hypothetical protein
MARLVRKQVYITPEQESLLKGIAAREKRSEADIIRTALDERLRPGPPGVRRKDGDALWDIIGVGASDRRDVSEDVDHYLYGRPRR